MSFLEELDAALASHDGIAAALKLTIAHFRADAGTVHLLGPDSALHLKAASDGIPEQVLSVVRQIPAGKGMAGIAFERKQPVSVCDIQTGDHPAVRAGAGATGMKGALVVPILDGAEAVGALGIGNRGERDFTPEETELLMEAGRRIARGIAQG